METQCTKQTHNKALHLTAFPLRSKASGELGRYPAETHAPPFLASSKSLRAGVTQDNQAFERTIHVPGKCRSTVGISGKE